MFWETKKEKILKNLNLIFGFVGLISILPSLILILGSILFSIFRLPEIALILNPRLAIFQPTTMMSGLLIAIATNLPAMLKTNKLKKLNLYVFSSACVLFCITLLYLAAESNDIFYILSY